MSTVEDLLSSVDSLISSLDVPPTPRTNPKKSLRLVGGGLEESLVYRSRTARSSSSASSSTPSSFSVLATPRTLERATPSATPRDTRSHLHPPPYPPSATSAYPVYSSRKERAVFLCRFAVVGAAAWLAWCIFLREYLSAFERK